MVAIVTVSWRDENGRRTFHYDEVMTGKQLIAVFNLPMGITERFEEEMQEPWKHMPCRALVNAVLAPKRTSIHYSDVLFFADTFRTPSSRSTRQ